MGIGAALTSTVAVAQQSGTPNEFRPYAQVSVAYDTNFFRVENSLQKPSMPTDSGLSDTYAGIGAGFDGFLDFGVQKLTFAAEATHQVHDKFSEVDFTGGAANMQFEWGTDSALSGVFGYAFRRELVDFDNQNRPHIDYRNTHELEASISRQVSTRWRVNASGGASDIEFDVLSESDPKRVYGGLGLTYTSRQNNTIDLSAMVTERNSSGVVDMDFREFSVGPDVLWALSPKVRLRAEIKYTSRDVDNPQLSDFEGAEGRFAVRWKAASKLQLSSVLRRDVSSLGDQLSNYAVVDSLRLSASWEASEKLLFALEARGENRDFREEPSVVIPGLDVRDDDLTYVTLRTDWTPRRTLVCWLQIGTGDRHSNRVGQDFDYQRYAAGLRIYF